MKLNLFFFIIIFLLGCSEGKHIKSSNQIFADQVLNVFYQQSNEYETQIRPYFNNQPTNEKFQEIMSLWAGSLERMVDNLKNVNNTVNVDITLVQKLNEIVDTSQKLISLLKFSEQNSNINDIGIYAEKISTQQSEFEVECNKRGLKILAIGID